MLYPRHKKMLYQELYSASTCSKYVNLILSQNLNFGSVDLKDDMIDTESIGAERYAAYNMLYINQACKVENPRVCRSLVDLIMEMNYISY